MFFEFNTCAQINILFNFKNYKGFSDFFCHFFCKISLLCEHFFSVNLSMTLLLKSEKLKIVKGHEILRNIRTQSRKWNWFFFFPSSKFSCKIFAFIIRRKNMKNYRTYHYALFQWFFKGQFSPAKSVSWNLTKKMSFLCET